MNEYDKQSYIDDLNKIIAYISTYVNAFEDGRYDLVDNDKDDNFKKGKFTIKHLNKILLSEIVSVLDKYSRNILRDFYGAGQIR